MRRAKTQHRRGRAARHRRVALNVAAERSRTLPGAWLTDVRPAEGRRWLDWLYSIITAWLSIIEKNGSGLFDSIFDKE